ncbi:curli-like amyloid fiber formation chaperone CsgH [Rhodopseudomonas sp. B29]|uniref:curli-like amyloid fiber formation chaperone CsgH n=1 Tax=Rhodopseudomonas sp. B29 TaxID=95607 RepID=UPI0003B48FCA|nr:curli-like amyloid fiber formation chaperone CsgH [Rhodopseudomonas sp. B29]
MGAYDLPPGVVCSVVRHEDGGRLEIRGRVISPQALQGKYVLQIKRTGPSGSSTVKQGGPFDLAAGTETFLGLANLNLEPGATVSTDFSLQIGDGVKLCEQGDGQ